MTLSPETTRALADRGLLREALLWNARRAEDPLTIDHAQKPSDETFAVIHALMLETLRSLLVYDLKHQVYQRQILCHLLMTGEEWAFRKVERLPWGQRLTLTRLLMGVFERRFIIDAQTQAGERYLFGVYRRLLECLVRDLRIGAVINDIECDPQESGTSAVGIKRSA